jgi:hypothetical protein
LTGAIKKFQMEKTVDKQTMVGMIAGLIEDSNTVGLLNACDVIVHDVLWTRYSEDQLVKQMKSEISVKRTDLQIQKDC